MNIKKTVTGFLFGAVALAAPVAVAQADTIVDIAVSDPSSFSSLVDAVVSQELAETLSSEGPFTVFAPTNDAFKKLPGFVGKAIAADMDENGKSQILTDILLYHVVSGNLDSGAVLASAKIETLGGDIMPNIRGNGNGSKPYVNSSKIIATDVVAENGTIHVIDKVLLPENVVKNAFITELKRLQGELVKLEKQLKKQNR